GMGRPAVSGEPAASAAKVENPYRAAKVGDYVVFRLNNEVEGEKSEGVLRMEVIAKDEKEAVVKTEITLGGEEQPPQEQRIVLQEAYDPWQPLQPGAQIERIAAGEESIKVAGKEYRCQWQEVRIVVPIPGGQTITTSKSWFAKDVPLSGLVKMESRFESKIGEEKVLSISSLEMTEAGTQGNAAVPR
ncbi:MAG: hypothetical protein N3A66_02585, partial [Planctomycetota bacterium]|nr:hypothetical protein [Planctomycetota bacterium]